MLKTTKKNEDLNTFLKIKSTPLTPEINDHEHKPSLKQKFLMKTTKREPNTPKSQKF